MNPCKSGVASFLSEQQASHRMKSLSKSILCGVVGTGVLFGADYGLNLNLSPVELGIPFAVCLISGVLATGIGSETRNAEYVKAYNAMCKED
jgi:hypothetical protein